MRQPKQPASGNTAIPHADRTRAAQQADPHTGTRSWQRMQSQAMHDEDAPQGRSGLTARLPCAEAPLSTGHVNPRSPALYRVRLHGAQCLAAFAAVHYLVHMSHSSVQMLRTQQARACTLPVIQFIRPVCVFRHFVSRYSNNIKILLHDSVLQDNMSYM